MFARDFIRPFYSLAKQFMRCANAPYSSLASNTPQKMPPVRTTGGIRKDSENVFVLWFVGRLFRTFPTGAYALQKAM